jgi:Vacuolar protein sorting-associated protein 62
VALFNEAFWVRVATELGLKEEEEEEEEEEEKVDKKDNKKDNDNDEQGDDDDDDVDDARSISIGRPASSNCFVVARDGQLHQSFGYYWERVTSPASVERIKAVHVGEKDGSVVALDSNGSLWLVRDCDVRNASGDRLKEWRSMPGQFESVSVAGLDCAYALDCNGRVFRWRDDDKSWSIDNNTSDALVFAEIACGVDGSLWAVDVERRVVHRQRDGKWTAVPVGSPALKFDDLDEVEKEQQREKALEEPQQESNHRASSASSSASSSSRSGALGSSNDGRGALEQRLSSIVAGSGEHAWLLDARGNAYTFEADACEGGAFEPIGNTLPLRSVSVNSVGTAWGVTRRGVVYALSRKRLHVALPRGFHRCWDDRKSRAKPCSMSMWRPLPPAGYHVVGFKAERGHKLEPNTTLLVMREYGGDVSPQMLARPLDFQPTWNEIGSRAQFGPITFLQAVAPAGYVALGDLAVESHGESLRKPPLDSFRCVHADLVQPTSPVLFKPEQSDGKGLLWATRRVGARCGEASLWQVPMCGDWLQTAVVAHCASGRLKAHADEQSAAKKLPVSVHDSSAQLGLFSRIDRALFSVNEPNDVPHRTIGSFVVSAGSSHPPPDASQVASLKRTVVSSLYTVSDDQ